MNIDLSAATLEQLRAFMSRHLGVAPDSSTEAFGADLESNLIALMRAATRKMNAMEQVIKSKETVAARHQAQLTELAEAKNTLESERQANATLTAENEAMAGRLRFSQEPKALEILRVLAQTAAEGKSLTIAEDWGFGTATVINQDGAHTHVGADYLNSEQQNFEVFVNQLHALLVAHRGLSWVAAAETMEEARLPGMAGQSGGRAHPAEAEVARLQGLLAACVPMLHTGDELPVSYYIEHAPDSLLSRIALASGRYSKKET